MDLKIRYDDWIIIIKYAIVMKLLYYIFNNFVWMEILYLTCYLFYYLIYLLKWLNNWVNYNLIKLSF
jgi:hypothetical protein